MSRRVSRLSLALVVVASVASVGTVGWAAEPSVALTPDPLVRPGVVYRCRVVGHDLPPSAQVVTVSLVEGDRLLAASELSGVEGDQLSAGVVAALLPLGPIRAPLLRVRVSDAKGRSLVQVEQAVPGVLGRDSVSELLARPALAPPLPPLPRLWLEQVDELLLRPVPSLLLHAELTTLLANLAAWPQVLPSQQSPGSTGSRTLALRDPVDGSVQPWRLTVPPGATRLVVLARRVIATKADWEPLPAAWLAAAATAGVAVAEVYPAGDPDFTGVARRRCELVQAIAQAECGLPGVVSLAHDGLARSEGWAELHPLPPQPAPAGHLLDWAQGPFVVVVGTGENQAARDDARTLANAFVRAWAMHAHGYPPVVDDTAFKAADWVGHHLVLVGSPRSNAVTRTYAAALPADWDDREVRVGARIAHRSRLPGFALGLPDPQRRGRSLLVLDGSPAWRGLSGDLPLAAAAPLPPIAEAPLPLAAEAATADLVLLPGDASEGPALRLLLESRPAGP